MNKAIRLACLLLLPVVFAQAQQRDLLAAAGPVTARPWLDPQMPLDQRVETLLAVMTPADKMELLREGWGIPGVARLGIPALKKVEAVHGFSYGSGATIFPQSIGLGATWDKALAEKVAMAIGDETVSAHAVQAWSPVLDVAQDPRWGRCEETYGEDPVLVSEIGGAWIKGYQSRGIIVTPKHFAGHGAVMGGRDSHDLGLSERELREIHLVPFRHVIETYHCQSIMMAYSDFEGVPVAKSKELLKGILREEWGFDGFIVSDCGAIGNLTSRKHYTAHDAVEAANEALAAGIATNCGDTYNNPAVIEAAKQGTIDRDNLDFTCRTLLRTMFRNGFFEHNPSEALDWNKVYPGWNSPEHKALARQAARESIVLLENKDKLLPLSTTTKTIAVIGPGADDLQPGDYTPKLQPGQLVSVLAGIRGAVGPGTRVVYEKGCEFAWGDSLDPRAALAAAARADIVIMVLGDASTSEAIHNVRNTSGENRDYATLILPGDQEKLLEAVCATGKPVILVLQAGRPYNLSYAAAHCKAILVNWLPGEEGGPATADVLFGAYDPAGRLPMTFPRDASQLPLYYNFKTSGRGYDYVDLPFHPLYPFGYGLSYTTFTYSGISTRQNEDGTVSVNAKVTNTGQRDGDEVVQLYVTEMYASVKTRVMELKDFQRIHLAVGESKQVAFTLTPYQLSLLNDQMDRVVEPGAFRIMVGGHSPDYTAADRIKNSVGFRSASEGVNDSLEYTRAYKADFVLAPGTEGEDPSTHKKMVPVVVTNQGNLTDVGKLSLYVNGVQQGDVHHFELAPGASKTISFPLTGTGDLDCIFTTKYKSAARRYTLTADSPLMAGTAKINLTPRTDEPVHDSIFARALVLKDKGVLVAFVAVDLAVFTSARIEQRCKELYGIDKVMLSSSHNHSEPQPGGKRSFQGNPYTAFYEDQIIKAVGEAVHGLFPARISAGHQSFPQLGFNRLIVREDGHARESWFSDDQYTSENPERIPFGPVDPEVGVIRIDDLQGEPRVILMNYACHADIVCFNYAVSADYPGVACRKVEEAFGNRVNCLFIQGAGGNIESLQISSRRKGPDDPFQTDYAPMERTGELLAFQTVKLARSLTPAPGKQEIRYLDDSLHFTGRFNKKLDYSVHLSTLLINRNIAIAVCPGELFVQLQLDWKRQMTLAEVKPFLFGYTWSQGSWPGYVADVRSAALGGYGADQGDNLIEPGAGEAIMTRQLADFYHLNDLMREKPGPVGFKAGAQWIVKPF